MTKGLVLVVEDDASARSALAELLRDEEYRVETAADGLEALARVEAEAPDIVLTDLRMPRMDGLELMRQLRAGDSDAAVVVMTAFGAADLTAAAMKEGAADYLTKPVKLADLVLVLAREMKRRRGSAPPLA